MKKFNFLLLLLCSHFFMLASTLVAAANEKPLTTTNSPANSLLLKELNTSHEAQSYPWLSDDGLRVYYTHDKFFYMASRTATSEKFGNGNEVMILSDHSIISGWLTSDELTVYYATQNSELIKATRKNNTEKFSSPQKINLINAPKGSLFDASFTPDMQELLMYNNDDRERIVRFIKTGENEYIFSGEVKLGTQETPTGGQLTRDGLRFYVPFRVDKNGNADYRKIFVLSRPSVHEEFNAREEVKTSGPINTTAYQPTINADETLMIFVTGSENLWDYNDLCEVPLVKDLPMAVMPAKTTETIITQVSNPQVFRIGNTKNGTIPAIYITADQNSTKTNNHTGEINVPGDYLLQPPTDVIITAPVDSRLKIDMRVSPNPFSEKTAVEINVPYGGHLIVQAYAMDGQLVAVLFDGQAEKGIKILSWLKNNIANGLYTIKASMGNNIVTKKVVVCDGTN